MKFLGQLPRHKHCGKSTLYIYGRPPAPDLKCESRARSYGYVCLPVYRNDCGRCDVNAVARVRVDYASFVKIQFVPCDTTGTSVGRKCREKVPFTSCDDLIIRFLTLKTACHTAVAVVPSSYILHLWDLSSKVTVSLPGVPTLPLSTREGCFHKGIAAFLPLKLFLVLFSVIDVRSPSAFNGPSLYKCTAKSSDEALCILPAH